jgi:hypothetical protein
LRTVYGEAIQKFTWENYEKFPYNPLKNTILPERIVQVAGEADAFLHFSAEYGVGLAY